MLPSSTVYFAEPRQRPPNITNFMLAGPCCDIINIIHIVDLVRETPQRTGKSTGKRIKDNRPNVDTCLAATCYGIESCGVAVFFQVVSATFQFENSPLCFLFSTFYASNPFKSGKRKLEKSRKFEKGTSVAEAHLRLVYIFFHFGS